VAQYRARLSGPLLDRIDLAIDVPAVTATDLILPAPSEGSREAAARVALARRRQAARFVDLGLGATVTNAACPAPVLEEIARPDADGLKLVRDAADAMKLSARSFHRVLRVARTIADLDDEDSVRRIHLAEALSYRDQAGRRPRAA
jgi:magnesium chelatase family protein